MTGAEEKSKGPWALMKRRSGSAVPIEYSRNSSELAARRIARGISQVFRDHLANAGLTPTQYSLLAQLQEGPLRSTDLAHLIGVAPSTLSRNLRPLLQAALIEFAPPSDARNRPLRLTAKGARQQNQGHGQCEAAEQALRTNFGEEMVKTLHLLADAIHPNSCRNNYRHEVRTDN